MIALLLLQADCNFSGLSRCGRTDTDAQFPSQSVPGEEGRRDPTRSSTEVQEAPPAEKRYKMTALAKCFRQGRPLSRHPKTIGFGGQPLAREVLAPRRPQLISYFVRAESAWGTGGRSQPSPIGSSRLLPKRDYEKRSRGLCGECHFECHCAGKIRKQTRTHESGRKNPQVLNCWPSESYTENAHIHWALTRSAQRLPLSPPTKC